MYLGSRSDQHLKCTIYTQNKQYKIETAQNTFNLHSSSVPYEGYAAE